MDPVQLCEITKRFGTVMANDRVSLDLRAGEVHALVGENGAGKTTLMKILFGLVQPDSGTIHLDGKPVTITSPQVAGARGIGMVHQHFMLLPSLSVAENIVLGMEPTRRLLIDRQRARALTHDLSTRYGLHVDPDSPVRELPVGVRQRVEILKALARGVRVLILDEPTAVLTPQEANELFGILKSLVATGMSVIFITHKLHEVMRVSDRVTVMRMGQRVGTVATKATSSRELARMMIGRDYLPTVPKSPPCPGKDVLVVRGLHVENNGVPALRGVDLTLRAGEIVCVAGVEGNGQTELAETLTGLRRASHGRVWLDGRDMTNESPRRVREADLAGIPEDRLKHGVATTATIRDNVAIARYYQAPLARHGLLSPRRLLAYARDLTARYDIRTPDLRLPASSLSGGNMQKLVVARELSRAPRVLVAAQPTRGVDIGAVEAIHRRIVAERDRGAAVLVISAELAEVMALADRIVAMYDGRITGSFAAGTIDEEELGLYMLGLKRQMAEAPAGDHPP